MMTRTTTYSTVNAANRLWRAPTILEQRPLLTAGGVTLAVAAIVAVAAGAANILGIDTGLSRVLATLALAALTAALLTRWRAWRAVGFTGPRAWRDPATMILPLVIALWPFAFGLQVGLPALALVILLEIPNSFCEEALYRGVVVRAFRGRAAWQAAVVSGVMFGALHLLVLLWGQPFESALPLVVITSLFGIGYAAMRIRTGTIWAPLVLHAGWNVSQNTSNAAAALGESLGLLVLFAAALIFPIYGLLLLRGRKVDA